ncbi:hypothetical protein JZO66_02180 [Enterococcus sp. DIV0242_7C1]|uniref:ABC transporter domain-containing protein n=1 Tax=Candidatus Enterococcus dunnyi TaxID=1834192 RepID=A0A200JFJ3_9ENTE|nr:MULTISPECIES: hypothetical protein [unclassified Enterococcus]MBO0469338.1 hypothetical protein [Enterococcus sp. DIV0242_7C1]MCA5012921.1 hypothetical protein [Enterococcus sp. S23]MCA5016172.1 hypothetical protein [Enterococcus sp. S22(2020)]OUZ35367.1 hypothetical protein A5889_000843 [Enterococcus sp. 9D6_DIV0238]
MDFSLQNFWTQERFNELFQEQHMTVILEDQSRIQADFFFLIDKTFDLKQTMAIGFILSENTFLPYLSIRDNLFLGTSIKEKNKKPLLIEQLSYVGLTHDVLIKSESDLNTLEVIKLQLVQLLLLDKDIIIIDDIFQKLSIGQRQELLPLLQKIAKEKKKAILVLTNDIQIAESPYMDKIIHTA